MQEQENINQQLGLLQVYRRNLSTLIHQFVVQGGEAHASLNVINGIIDCRKEIHRIKGVLRSWFVKVEDLPDDDDPLSDTNKTSLKQPIVDRTKIYTYAQSIMYELMFNLQLLDEPVDELSYLIDENYLELIRSGHISWLPFVIIQKTIIIYSKCHGLNRMTEMLRNNDTRYSIDAADSLRIDIINSIQDTTHLIRDDLPTILDHLNYDDEEDMSLFAVYSLRFELESNKMWSEDMYKTQIYLRDDAWKVFKEKEQTFILSEEHKAYIYATYKYIYKVNDFYISKIRGGDLECADSKAVKVKMILVDKINRSIEILGFYYPKVEANFRM